MHNFNDVWLIKYPLFFSVAQFTLSLASRTDTCVIMCEYKVALNLLAFWHTKVTNGYCLLSKLLFTSLQQYMTELQIWLSFNVHRLF